MSVSEEEKKPAAADTHYSERLVALPHLGVCIQPLQPALIAPDFATLGLLSLIRHLLGATPPAYHRK